MEIDGIEDTLIEAFQSLGLFVAVDSIGRDKEPPADQIFSYPYASVFFVGDREISQAGRPIDELTFGALVTVKNVAGEAQAAEDAYQVINAGRDAVRGKTLGIDDIEPFSCRSRELAGYEDGAMTYLLIFTTRHYRPVVVE